MTAYYSLSPNDQPYDVRLLWLTNRKPPYFTLRPRYAGMVCPRCARFDYDAVFNEGFDEDIAVRAKGKFFQTTDGFYCFDDRFLSFIEQFKIGGLAVKPLGKSGWHVCNIRQRVGGDQNVYTVHKPPCPECGRARNGVTGRFYFQSEIEPPTGNAQFFGLTFDRQGYNGDRDLFATEDVVLGMKEAGLRGLCCFRLMAGDDAVPLRQAIERNEVFKWPKGTRIIL